MEALEDLEKGCHALLLFPYVMRIAEYGSIHFFFVTVLSASHLRSNPCAQCVVSCRWFHLKPNFGARRVLSQYYEVHTSAKFCSAVGQSICHLSGGNPDFLQQG